MFRATFCSLTLVALLGSAPCRADEVSDPLESWNRAIFGFNTIAYDSAVKPLADLYRRALPVEVRRSVGNFVSNLKLPVVMANEVLQGEFKQADGTFRRFAINSTIGYLGLTDPATAFGLPRHQEDFGQTLARYGVPAGPYLVLPLLGPSNVRDAVGRFGDYLMLDSYLDTEATVAVLGASGLGESERNLAAMADVASSSLDPYASLRSAYDQWRSADIANGEKVVGDPSYDDLFREQP
ncbi:MAG: VacJ family lipoprotein [Geminicoccaceae bacterium]